jgi:adenylate cyclase class 2
MLEIEIKLRVASARSARRMLKAAGFDRLGPRVLEDNEVFDTAGFKLRRSGVLLRVRTAGNGCALTYKGPAAPGRYKSRQELEIMLSQPRTATLILGKLGFRRVFRYQKYRTTYVRERARGMVTLDETPIGCFLEIEGAPRWIDRTARALGFRESDYITASYGGLYLEFCQAHGRTPHDMVFAGAT